MNKKETLTAHWTQWNALIVMSFAGLTMLGWIFDISLLTRIYEDLIPMAPSTAALFIWFGCGVYLKTSRSLSGPLWWFIFVVSIFAIVVSFLLFTFSSQGIYSNFEYLGMDIAGDVQGAPVGHMSPFTALCFILSGVSFLIGLKDRPSVWLIIGGIGLSGFLIILSIVFLIGYFVNTPFLYGGVYVPPALNTVLSILILNFSLYSLIKSKLSLKFSSENIQRYYLFETMVLVALGIAILSLYVLYESSFKEKKADLINIAQSRARVIEAVARFDLEQSTDFPKGNVEATLSQFREAHKEFEGFGRTGEYTLAKLESDQIVFLLRHRHSTQTQTQTQTSIPISSFFVEPMRRALKGESGAIVELDYRGEVVLAAYEPVGVLNLGLVVKIDLAEIREPFIKAGLVVGSGGLVIITLGLFAFFQLSEPLIKSIEKLSQVAQQIPISVLITDEKGNIEFANETASRLSGYSLEEVLGENPRMFKSGESPDTYYKVLWETISRGQEWRGVFHNKKKNGELYWESVLIFPLKDINGKVSNFIGLKEDITEKKELESTLIDHERLIRSVVNNLKDGLIIASKEGNIQLFNKGAEKIFGYKAKEVMEKPVAILMDESNKEKHDIGFARFQKTLKILSMNSMMEVVGAKKDGSPVPIELTLTQMEQRGEILVIGLVRDISERKEADKKMESAQKQLIAAQKLAGVGELAAGVSHEVLNPLNIISVHTQMLQRKTTDDSRTQDFCNKVKHEIDRIQKIMGSLLAFSRKGNSEFQKGQVRGEIEKTLSLVEEEYKLDNIKIVRDWCGTCADILFDPDKIRQVFLNLLHNAQQAMPEGGTITVGCSVANSEGKSYQQFTFSDTGRGMSEEVRLKIFEPFFTTKPEGEGTGMGLSVIHGIIEQHGGKIGVESEEGKGTTFTVSLPIAN